MRSRDVWLAVFVLGLLSCLVAGVASADGGRYVLIETVRWIPGDRVKDLTVALDALDVSGTRLLPDKIVCSTAGGGDFWMDIVHRGEAASDTVAGSGDVQVRVSGAGEGFSIQPVFLVSDALADTVYVRCYEWRQ